MISQRLETIGFNDSLTTTAVAAVLTGADIVRQIHGASPERLQTMYKAEAAMTPRTIADMLSGEAIKSIIRSQFPEDRINEEETGDELGVTGRDWHVDPLDGTSSFAREQRYSTVGVAVYENGLPVAASLVNPFEGELLVAKRGEGAYLIRIVGSDIYEILDNPRKLQVSSVGLTNAPIIYVDALFNGKTVERKLHFIDEATELAKNNLGIRMTGSNIDQQRQVAMGRAEATFTDAVGGFFDLAAGGLIIQEAGGAFTDMYGSPVNEDTQVAIGSNGLFHEQLLQIARSSYRGYQGFK